MNATVRDRIVEILMRATRESTTIDPLYEHDAEQFAEALISAGVTIQGCAE